MRQCPPVVPRRQQDGALARPPLHLRGDLLRRSRHGRVGSQDLQQLPPGELLISRLPIRSASFADFLPDINTCASQSYQHEGLFSQAELAPGFASPPPQDMSYDDYVKYVDASMPQESPLLLGLHGNAELGFLNSSVELHLKSIRKRTGPLSRFNYHDDKADNNDDG